MISWFLGIFFSSISFFDRRSEYEKQKELEIIDSIKEAYKEHWLIVGKRGGIRKIKKESDHYKYALNESSRFMDKVWMFFDKRTPYERWEERETLNQIAELGKHNHIHVGLGGGISVTPRKEKDYRKQLEEASKRAS